MSHSDTIMGHLKDLKDKHERIEACMVAKKGLEGLILMPETFRDDVGPVWEPLSKTLDDMLGIVATYGCISLKSMYVEMLGYGVFLNVLATSEIALIVFVKGERPIRYIGEIADDIDKTRDCIIGCE